MIPYFLLLLVPSTFALVNTRKVSLLLWLLTFFLFVVFVGFRFEVGPDWQPYVYIHSSISNQDFGDIILQAEPLSYLLFWISEKLGFEVYLSNVVGAIIMMVGVFSFARRTANPWIAVLAAAPYFIIVMGMSGVRQAMAAGIILLLFSRWERYSLLTRCAYILIAAMFHTSALINNIFLVTKLNIPLRYKVVFGALIFLLTMYLSFEVSMYADNVARYKQRYLDEPLLVMSFGSLYHILMIAIPAVIGFLFRKRIVSYIHSPAMLRYGLYAVLIVIVINFISSTVASRLTVYLYFIPMMVYPALMFIFGKRAQSTVAFLIIVFHITIMAAWLMLGNHSFAYVPYKNVLFQDE